MTTIRKDLPNHFSLPRRLGRLGELAYNLWWVWNPDAQALFTRLDKSLWNRLNHNPVAFLYKIERPVLNAAANDLEYLDLYDRVMEKFDAYMQAKDTWFQRTYPEHAGQQIAYFSFEFGLHESVPVYAGGLGILSGDHLKEASDLGMPLTAIGFVYNQGYFSQHITEDGWQETRNLYLNFSEMPLIPLMDEKGHPVTVSVDLPGRVVYARLWMIQVGRISLYLLDTNTEQNSPADQQLTARLYSNDLDIRISQEILLGMGGVRALRLLGYNPSVWHMNEGHSAFLALERAMEFVRQGKTFAQAAEIMQKSNVFTTHTPVPAGNDQFPMWLVDKYFNQIWPLLGLSANEFMDLGRQAQGWGDAFVMPVLALRLSEQRNAVSELHGRVSRQMWHWIYPERSVENVPITHITNGVHTGTWIARRLRLLLDHYVGENWEEHLDDQTWMDRVLNIPDAELWALRYHLKRKLIVYANERARQQWLSGSIHPVQVVAGGVMLEPFALTIGFARRFATYKRGNLILRDFDRFMNLINSVDQPVQVIFAGKAHPADEPGKLLIQQVYRAVKDSRSGGRLAFLEDYDMNMARYLVQGVDVWMNTPRRPNEASGTSGMKAALNGTLNFSILDGWWREGFNGHNGWSIGQDRDYSDQGAQDDEDANSLYHALEDEIIPLYYKRGADGLPHEWLARVKESIRTLLPQFSTRRMLKEYMHLYQPCLKAEAARPNGKKVG